MTGGRALCGTRLTRGILPALAGLRVRTMHALNAIDLGFLSVERREMPMHVGALLLFSLPEGAPPDHLRKLYELALQDRFRYPLDQRLHHPASRMGVPHWVQDEDFDVAYHLRHSALPFPGRYRELFVLVSRLHGTLLDRSRPLWEVHLIEGLKNDQFAMYFKVHHALIDGMGAMRMLREALSEDPARRDMPFPWSLDAEQSRPPPADKPRERGDMLNRALEAVGAQFGLLPGVSRTLARALRSRSTPQDARLALPFEAPRSALNTPITGARRFVAQSYSLSRIQAVGRAFGADSGPPA